MGRKKLSKRKIRYRNIRRGKKKPTVKTTGSLQRKFPPLHDVRLPLKPDSLKIKTIKTLTTKKTLTRKNPDKKKS